MELLIDILLVWALFSVCIAPVLLAIQLVTNIRWYKKFYAAMISKQEANNYILSRVVISVSERHLREDDMVGVILISCHVHTSCNLD